MCVFKDPGNYKFELRLAISQQRRRIQSCKLQFTFNNYRKAQEKNITLKLFQGIVYSILQCILRLFCQ